MSAGRTASRRPVAFVTALMVVLALAIPFTGVATANHGNTAITQVTIDPRTDSALTGQCNQFTVTARSGNATAEGETIDITANQSDTNDTIQDLQISFCDPVTGAVVQQTASPGGAGQTSTGAQAAGTDCDDDALIGGTPNRNGGACNNQPGNAEAPAEIHGECLTTSSGTCTFGVTSNEAGTMTVVVFAETVTNNNRRDTNEPFDSATKTWTAGGPEAARSVACTPATDSNPEGSRHEFQCTVTGDNGAIIPGVTVMFDVTAGPNAEEVGPTACPTATNQQGSTPAANEPAGQETGTATDECAYTDPGPNVTTSPPGTDTITAFVNQSTKAGQPAATNGPDAGEPQTTIQKTWTGPGRVLDCEPETATNQVGTSHVVTCTVRDASGNPVSGVDVSFTESGPGSISSTGTTPNPPGGAQTYRTNSSGQVQVTVQTNAGEATGTQTITGTITGPTGGVNDPTVECGRPAGQPTGAAAGACSDSVTKTWTAQTGPQCNDGVDNDGDGRIDFGQDPGCADISDTTESPDPDPEPVRVASNVTIRNDRNDNAFKGSVGSSRKACQVGRQVVLKRRGDGTVGRDTTNRSGNWRIANDGRRGRYSAVARRSTATARNGTPLICLGDRSPTIKVGRRG
jgi:hypothetical protein